MWSFDFNELVVKEQTKSDIMLQHKVKLYLKYRKREGDNTFPFPSQLEGKFLTLRTTCIPYHNKSSL